jgi:hypothetical protein
VNESTPHHVEENFFPDDSGGEPPRWRRPFTWVTLVAIGWVLYELTARPALGSVAVCIKFGWEDFRTALWLRRRDPYLLRGRACFWLHLASGLFRIASVAGLMSIAFIALGHTFPARPGGVERFASRSLLDGVDDVRRHELFGPVDRMRCCAGVAGRYQTLAWQ